jgi:hypothetical protein
VYDTGTLVRVAQDRIGKLAKREVPMTLRNADGWVRLGMLALPLAGLLALVGLYGTLKLGAGGILATGDNRAIVSTGFFASVFLGNVLALTVLIFGVVALHAFLANSGEKLLATGGMILSIVGIALMLPRLGVIAYAVPALSRSFLNGDPETIRIIDSIFAGPLGTIETVTMPIYSAGFFLFGIAIWRCGVLPRWAGVMISLHAPLITGPLVGSVAGALLALVGGGWIALSSVRILPDQTETEAMPRVR